LVSTQRSGDDEAVPNAHVPLVPEPQAVSALEVLVYAPAVAGVQLVSVWPFLHVRCSCAVAWYVVTGFAGPNSVRGSHVVLSIVRAAGGASAGWTIVSTRRPLKSTENE